MKKVTTLLLGLFMLGTTSLLGQVTIDGSKSGDSQYVLLAEWDQANTGFGDHGITHLYSYADETNLYVMVVGEIESNFNELYVFLGVEGESNVTAGVQLPTGSDGSSPFNSFNPTLDFDASFGIRMTSGNASNAFPSIIDYRSSGNTDTYLTTIANDGTLSTISSGTYNGVVVAYDDTGLLSSNTGVEGFEIKIPLTTIGADGNSEVIRIMSVYGNDADMSANTIPQIAGQSGTNLGNDPDFSSISGEQNSTYGFVSITGDAGWRLLSLPKTGGLITDISDDTPVQGVTGGDNTGSDANFIIYDSDATFEQPTNVTTAWGDGLGFGLYFYDNTTAGSAELPVTLDASGAEPSSDVTVTLNPAASGYTLVGNPFASNFDVSTMTATSSNISSNVAFWNNGTSSYTTQSISSSYIVAPWQGFWVQTTSAAATTLTIPTAGKSTSSTSGTFFSKTVANTGDIEFSLSSENTYDEAIRLSFREGATTGYDRDDFGKLTPLLSSYATMAFMDGEQLKSVESLPYDLEERITVALEQQLVGVSGEFTLAWSGLESIPSEWVVTFHDYETGESVNLREAGEYTFTAEAAVQAKANPLSILTGPQAIEMQATGDSRFGVTIDPAVINSVDTEESPELFALEQNYPNPFNPSTTITYSVDKAGAVNLSVYNLMGQRVAELVSESKTAGSYNVQWNAAGVASGMYYYRLEAGGQSITRKMTLIK